MNLLYLCHRVPYPPNKGEKIRAYHHLVHLARGHRVHLSCFADTREDLEHARSLEAICASVDVIYRSQFSARLHALMALPTGRSLSVAAFDSPALRAKVERQIREHRPDVLVAYSAAMAQYFEPMSELPRVLDFVDADSEKWRAYGRLRPFPQSALYALEADRLARYEARMALEFDASIFVSQAEADIVRRLAPGRALSVIPNGVDLEHFRPRGERQPPAAPVIVFTGVMNYFPNVDAVTYFAIDILPLVRSEVPEAQFRIVGREPDAAVQRLARFPGVHVTGSVPDVRPHLADAALAVAPFRIARGIQNKVLEAMASGLPVVGTALAFQSMPAGPDDGIRSADSAKALARAVTDLLREPDLRRDLGQRARRYVERHHRWEHVGVRLEAALIAAANGGHAARAAGTPR